MKLDDLKALSQTELVELGKMIQSATEAEAERLRVERSRREIGVRNRSRLAEVDRKLDDLREEKAAWGRVEVRLREALAAALASKDERAAQGIAEDLADLSDRGFESVSGAGCVAHGPIFEYAEQEGLGVSLNRAHLDYDELIAELERKRATIAAELERAA